MRDERPILPDAKQNRVSRRQLARMLLTGVAAGALPAAISPLHPIHRHLLDGILLDSVDEVLAGSSYQPAFLSTAQFAAANKLSEAIIPGSEKAQSAQFIDLLLSVDTANHQEHFVASLSAIDSAARKAFNKGVAQLNENELRQLLEAASAKDSADYQHFANLKHWCAGAYYSSEIGMRELGWTPDRVFPVYPACVRTESHSEEKPNRRSIK